MRRWMTVTGVSVALVIVLAPVAWACGFLVSPNGAVNLARTTTFVAWEDGVERYITNFTFEGPAESFGSIIPLPAIPTDVRRAGDWTLQRLLLEIQEEEARLLPFALNAAGEGDGATVIFRTQVDSLDIVVLEGGATDVLTWVNDNGFILPEGPATTHLLDFYASRSPYFLAARFDPVRAEDDGFVSGDGIPVQITMPTPRPWVPLHILHGAKPDTSVIEADVFLLTPDRPDLLHGEGLRVNVSEVADDLLLDDLRSDENMDWVPKDGWFTHLVLEADAEDLVYDLSVGVEDMPPSFVEAGLTRIEPTRETLEAFGLEPDGPSFGLVALLIGSLACGLVGGWLVCRS